MLTPFVRDSSYFQIIRNSNQLITGYIFDNEFSKIINYINNKLLSTLDNLTSNKIAGVLDSDGYLLRNIGDGSTQFNRLRENDIPHGIITFNRFANIVPNSILYCNTINLNYITATVQGSTIINNVGNCNFGLINAVNIQDRTITSSKIALGTLNFAHLDPLIANLNINGIYGRMIQDNALTGVNIADTAVTVSKMSTALIALRNPDPTMLILTRQIVTGLIGDTHIIKTNMIAQNAIPFNYMFGNNQVLTNGNLPIGALSFLPNANISPYSVFNAGNLLTRFYIADNSFTPNNNGNAAAGINKYKLSQAIVAKLVIGGLT